jgi:hypothetical protein
MKTRLSIRLISLALGLGLLGCGGGGQTFLKESGADHKQVEKMNWDKEPSAEATNWTTYMDLEGG